MPDKIGSNLSGALDMAMAAGQIDLYGSAAKAAAKPKVNKQAEHMIRQYLQTMGMGNSLADMYLGGKTFSKLLSSPFRPVNAETRGFIKTLHGLHTNKHASNSQRAHFLLQWADLKPGKGARKAFESLLQMPAFWRSLSNGQRDLIAKRLGGARDAAQVKNLRTAYATILGSDLFRVARDRGKKTALSQPIRAHRLLKRWQKSGLKLPVDVKSCRREAWKYAKYYSGYKTPKGQKNLYQRILGVRDKVLFRFFEEVKKLQVFAGRHEFYGERFLRFKAFSWEQTAHAYSKQDIKNEKCGLFNGRGSYCID